MRFAKIDADGTYAPPPPANQRSSYSTMVYVRATIVRDAGDFLCECAVEEEEGAGCERGRGGACRALLKPALCPRCSPRGHDRHALHGGAAPDSAHPRRARTPSARVRSAGARGARRSGPAAQRPCCLGLPLRRSLVLTSALQTRLQLRQRPANAHPARRQELWPHLHGALGGRVTAQHGARPPLHARAICWARHAALTWVPPPHSPPLPHSAAGPPHDGDVRGSAASRGDGVLHAETPGACTPLVSWGPPARCSPPSLPLPASQVQ